MRFSTFSVMVTASVALAAPAHLKRQNAAALNSDASLLSSPNAAAAAGAISPDIVCPPVDKDGTALTASSSTEDEGNEFAVCTYGDAGQCTFFFADGSFSSGSSTCPKGLPQPAGGAGASKPTSTTSTTTPPQTTQAPPPPPPPPQTTSSTQAPPQTTAAPPPPPVTTSDTPLPPPPATSSTQDISVVVPPPPSSTPPPASTPAPTPPAAPTSSDSDDDVVTVVVSHTVEASPSADGGIANVNSGLGEGNGAMPRGAGGVTALVALGVVLFALL